MPTDTKSRTDYLNETRSAQADAYRRAYGVQYPEGHIIRCYEQVLQGELGLDGSNGEKLLDFGCGTGTHCVYFQSKGFDVYGVDSDPLAIEQCKKRFPDIPTHFKVIDPKPDGQRDFFDATFDLVQSNQVLYYLSDPDLRVCLEGLHRQMKQGGIFIASMMATAHYFFARSEPEYDGLRRVSVGGEAEPQVYHISFTASKDDLRERFRLFEVLHVGHYDFSILQTQPSRLHYLFVGRKS